MSYLWQVIFYQPLFNLLVFCYNLSGANLAFAIILVTVIIKLVFYPLSGKALKSQRALQDLQPKVDALRAKYKDSKEELAKELMLLYKNERVSPFSSCLPMLVQLPFLFAIYQVFQSGLSSGSLNLLYPFVSNPEHINSLIFGIWDLSKPTWVLAIITAAAQYFQAKMLVHTKPPVATPGSQDESLAASMNKQALYIMPVVTAFFGFTLPGGLMLYWFVNTALTIGQQYLTFRHHGKQPPVST